MGLVHPGGCLHNEPFSGGFLPPRGLSSSTSPLSFHQADPVLRAPWLSVFFGRGAYFLQSAFSLHVSSVYISLAKSYRRHGHACHFSATVTQLHFWSAELLRGRGAHVANTHITLTWAPNTEQGMGRQVRVWIMILRGAWLFYPKLFTLKQASLGLWRVETPEPWHHFIHLASPPTSKGLRIAFENMYLSILPIFTPSPSLPPSLLPVPYYV